MPPREIVFATDQVYHLLNRSIEQRIIFKNKRDYQRFLKLIDFYHYQAPPLRFSFYNRLPIKEKSEFFKRLKKEGKPLVEVITYCLMPNHFHFLIKQLEDRGVSDFMRNLQNSYARYFNTKYQRNGPLFQSMFKAIRIKTDEQLIHVSRYEHLNPVTAYLIEVKDLKNYPWSSFPGYLNPKLLDDFVNPKMILDFFKSPKDYEKFVYDQAEYQRELQKIKDLTLED